MKPFSTFRAVELFTKQDDRPARLAAVISAALGEAADWRKRLYDMAESALGHVRDDFKNTLENFSDDNIRRVAFFCYAESNRISASEQVSVFMAAKHNELVSSAAAHQRYVPLELQQALTDHCFNHHETMMTLAANLKTHPAVLQRICEHPALEIRSTVAANLSFRMKVDEPMMNEAKDRAFKTIIENFEPAFAPHVIPACKDEDDLMIIFAKSPKSSGNLRKFVDNPYCPSKVLLEIATNSPVSALLTDKTVIESAKSLLDKRIKFAESTITSP